MNEVKPNTPEFDLIVSIEQAISVYTLKTGLAVQVIKVTTDRNGEAVVSVKTSRPGD